MAFLPDRIPSRRGLLTAGLAGGAAIALGGCSPPATELAVGRLPGNETYALNDGWLFGGQYAPASETQDYDDSYFEPVTLPHTVVPLSYRDWDPVTWQGTWIYRRHLDSGGVPARSRVIAEFDGVMVNATAVLNDDVISSHQGGYLPWSVELTDQLTDDDNLLAVVVGAGDLPVPPIANELDASSIDFMQPGGIYRDVRLLVVPRAYLADMFVLPRDVLTDPWLDIQLVVDATERLRDPADLTVVVRDGTTVLGVARATVRVPRPGTFGARLRVTGLSGVDLWSPDNPALYEVEATLTSAAGTHTRTGRTGFREAAFTTDGFFLNGQRLKIFGLDRHQLFPYTGMAMPERVQRKDAEMLKYELNCNMVRCSHYPQSPYFLDACDELGVMVWQETPGWHNIGDQAWQDLVVANVRDMVYRDRNRPSVIIWGTRLNETTDNPVLYRTTRQVARELDGSRPSSGAMDIHSTRHWDEDVFAFDDYHDPDNHVTLLPPLPNVPYLITESVGVLHVRPRHFLWTDPPRWLADQAVMHAQAHAQAAGDDRYCGLLAWAAFDYASPQAPRTGNVKTPGVADAFRIPKPGAAIYQAQTDPAERPVLIPVLAWDFHTDPPAPGQEPNLMVATNCDHVEVTTPGATLLAAPGPDPAYAHLDYPPVFATLASDQRGPLSELRITGYLDGQQVTEVVLSSDPAGFHLTIAADDEQITADGSDATRVVFRAVDANGNQVRYRHGDVTLRLTGPGTLVGPGVFPLGDYGGLGAVWVRSVPGRPGAITVTADHPKLGRAQVIVRSARSGARSISLD